MKRKAFLQVFGFIGAAIPSLPAALSGLGKPKSSLLNVTLSITL